MPRISSNLLDFYKGSDRYNVTVMPKRPTTLWEKFIAWFAVPIALFDLQHSMSQVLADLQTVKLRLSKMKQLLASIMAVLASIVTNFTALLDAKDQKLSEANATITKLTDQINNDETTIEDLRANVADLQLHQTDQETEDLAAATSQKVEELNALIQGELDKADPDTDGDGERDSKDDDDDNDGIKDVDDTDPKHAAVVEDTTTGGNTDGG